MPFFIFLEAKVLALSSKQRDTNLALYKEDIYNEEGRNAEVYTSFDERGESSQFTFTPRSQTEMTGFSKTRGTEISQNEDLRFTKLPLLKLSMKYSITSTPAQ